MRIGKVQGTVTLSRAHPSFVGARLKIVAPLSLAELASNGEPQAEGLVVYEQQLGADVGSLVAFSEGGEASQPFKPEIKPVDAYAAALLDKVEIARPAGGTK